MTVDQFANQIYELVVNTNSGKLILFNNEILSSLFNKKTSSCLFVLKAPAMVKSGAFLFLLNYNEY